MNKTKVIIISGPPGSGKSSQCERLSSSHGMIHISTGDIVRKAVRDGTTSLGKKAKPFLTNGDLLPDEMVFEIVEKAMQSEEAHKNGVILDGFPRNENQAKALIMSEHVKVERFILLDVNDDICVERILERYTDPVTEKVYNTKYIPPPNDEIKSRLIKRGFDHDEKIIRNRLAYYRNSLGSVLPLFSGCIQVVNGKVKPTEVEVTIAHCMIGVEMSNLDTKHQQLTQTKLPILKCTVCLDKEADHLIVPCGHQCGCYECLQRILDSRGKCPICRSNIQSLIKVFRVAADMDTETVDTMTNSMSQFKLATPPVNTPQVVSNGWDDNEDDSDVDDEKKTSPVNSVTLDVAPCQALTTGNTCDIAIAVNVPDITVKKPIDVVCVIDVSGSMGSAASYQTNDGTGVQNDGMTILDLVKHGVKTISHILGEHDRLAVVAFNNTSRIIHNLEYMTLEQRNNVEVSLTQMKASGGTNIWEGLRAGFEVLRTAPALSNKSRAKFVMLLTDGRPVTKPPRGHIAELEAYKESHPDFAFQISTFGFGYQLDSKLLHDLAVHGRGTFAFIPDAKILGTCFVDAVSNAVCCYAQKVDVHVILKNGSSFDENNKSLGNEHTDQSTSWGRVLSIAPLQLGVTHEFIIRIKAPDELKENEPYLEIVADVTELDGNVTKLSTMASSILPNDMSISAFARLETVSVGHKALDAANNGRGNKAIKMMTSLVNFITTMSVNTPRDHLVALLGDVGGRMSKSFQTNERWNRWGKHYIRALMRAHQVKQATNFMDPGLQFYGGTLFQQLREAGGEIFMSLPPPSHHRPNVNHQINVNHQTNVNHGQRKKKNKKKKKKKGRGKNRSVSPPTSVVNTPAVAAPPVVNMQTYYEGAGGGCFEGNNTVVVLNNENGNGLSTILLSQLQKGMHVQVYGGEFVEVECVIEIERPLYKSLIRLPSSKLCITPSHPIIWNGSWTLPKDIEEGQTIKNVDGIVYNVIIAPYNVLLVNNVPCVTWGHQLCDEKLNKLNPEKNAYYGKQSILTHIKQLPGYNDGYIFITNVRNHQRR